MPVPKGIPVACYDLMMKCWEYNPADREIRKESKKKYTQRSVHWAIESDVELPKHI